MKKIILAVANYWWVWPVIAMIVAYVLIMVLGNGQSVWFDEGYSIILAQHSIPELLALTAVDAHPPLFYILLKLWGSIFGWSEFALRSFPAILSSLVVGGMFLVVKKLFTTRVALVVLPFTVVAPFVLRYGYEIRMYSLALLIGVLATLVLVYASERKKSKLWILYSGLVALGMLTLYMSLAIWLAHAVWLFANWKKKSWKTFLKQPWVQSYIGAIALFAFYIPTVIYQLTHSALPGIGKEVTLTVLANIAGLVAVYTPEYKLDGLMSLGIIGVTALSVYLLLVAHLKMPKTQKSALWLMIILVTVPLFFFAIVAMLKPIFITRYIAHVSVYIYALVGLAVALGWRYGKRYVAIILAIIALSVSTFGVFQLQSIGNFIFERSQYPMSRQIRSDINCDKDTVIVSDDPYTYIDNRYYFAGCKFYFFSKDNVAKQGGYAPLSNSQQRLASSESLDNLRLLHLHWEGETTFKPDVRYRLVESKRYDKQFVDEYHLQ